MRVRERGSDWRKFRGFKQSQATIRHIGAQKYYGGLRKDYKTSRIGNQGNDLAWRKLEEISYTIFVDNIPESMSRSWIWQLFDHEGKVVDVFLSR